MVNLKLELKRDEELKKEKEILVKANMNIKGRTILRKKGAILKNKESKSNIYIHKSE